MSDVQGTSHRLHGVFLEVGAIHKIREALQIINHFTEEPDSSYGGMKIRHEVQFINSLLSVAVRGLQ